MKLFQNNDGAHVQAKAVLAYLSGHDGIENSWCEDRKEYLASPEVARWHNCREQGYVVTLRSEKYDRQINIAFFEHRNSDEICAVKWEQKTTNPPCIETAIFGNIYADKYDVSHIESYGKPSEMADWIYTQLTNFWDETAKAKGE